MRFAYTKGMRPLDGFTIQQGVGVGGFGEVYFAVSDAGKEVALKRIQRNPDVEVRGVTQCLNLKHSNLIAVYDLKYDADGQAWVVMEYVGGQSLKQAIGNHPGGLPPEEVERWFQGMAAGVSYLHECGLVHRDLKPGNVFDDGGVIKIGDYGLSKLIDAGCRSGQTQSVGTFHYMAPEIGKGSYGPSVDIYALGIILYEMLTGHVPFDGESSQEIIMKHLTDDPDLSRVPEPYRDVVRRALRKDPEKRFASVPAFLAAVQAAPPGAPGLGSSPLYIGDDASPPEIVFGPVRHHQVVLAEAVAAPAAATPGGRPAPPGPAAARSAPSPGVSPAAARDGTLKVLLTVAVAILLFSHPLLIPVALFIGAVYLLVVAIRSVTSGRFMAWGTRGRDERWRLATCEQLRHKPVGDRLAELSGALLVSAIVATILCGVFMLALGGLAAGTVTAWAQFAWLTLCSIAGAWLLLAVGKCWEGRDGKWLFRRGAMLVAGLLLAAVAFGASRLFFVDLAASASWNASWLHGTPLAGRLHDPTGTPLPVAYLLYFAGLFAPLRWWTQADPLRRSRLSLTAVAVCVLWAWIVQLAVGFPQPWGFLLAAAIAVSVQLAAPWASPREGAQP
jgi:hypothetical protein